MSPEGEKDLYFFLSLLTKLHKYTEFCFTIFILFSFLNCIAGSFPPWPVINNKEIWRQSEKLLWKIHSKDPGIYNIKVKGAPWFSVILETMGLRVRNVYYSLCASTTQANNSYHVWKFIIELESMVCEFVILYTHNQRHCPTTINM